MGEPVKIIDLARQIILLAGRQPDIDVKIDITGPRPGEKLFEEILHASEELVPTTHPGILLAAPRATDLTLLTRAIDELDRRHVRATATTPAPSFVASSPNSNPPTTGIT